MFPASLTVNQSFVARKSFNKVSGLEVGLPFSSKSPAHIYFYGACFGKEVYVHTLAVLCIVNLCAHACVSLCLAHFLMCGTDIPNVSGPHVCQ